MLEFEDFVRQETEWYSRDIARLVQEFAVDREARIRCWRALESAGLAPSGSYASINGEKNFNVVKVIIADLESFGFALEAIHVEDIPSSRAKRIDVPLPSGVYYHIYVYLSQDAECVLVEVSREPQPDRIKYELRCLEAADAA